MKLGLILFLTAQIGLAIAKTPVPQYFLKTVPSFNNEKHQSLYALALVNSRKKVGDYWVAWPWTVYPTGKAIHLRSQMELVRYLQSAPQTPFGLFTLTLNDFAKNGYDTENIYLLTQPETQVSLVSKHFFTAYSNKWLQTVAHQFEIEVPQQYKPEQQKQPGIIVKDSRGIIVKRIRTKQPQTPYYLNQLIADNAKRYNVPVPVIKAVIRTESAFNTRAVSSAGAKGLMQIMPITAKTMGVNPDKLFDPAISINTGTRFLAEQLQDFKSLDLALAAYNAGPGAVRKYGNKIPPYKETQNYVRTVKGFIRYYQRQGNGNG
ncbi:MAG: lytic transglycosylase domain-containing protein [Gammaproteobacteria bacterium]|nr:lytic transglycosylase domain-containing protein [Gammaproteobacteria bacterium]